MAELKTARNRNSVSKFLNSIENTERRKDARALVSLFKEVTGERPEMWGESIIGFGRYRYQYDSGREGEWFLAGFSPRKTSLTVYVMSGFSGCEPLLTKLGKHKTGKSCLYVNRLEEIDVKVLRRIVRDSVAQTKRLSRNR